MKKYIVITSIFAPNEAIKKFAALPDWRLIVVGDKKTPKKWQLENVIYLSPEDQEKLGFKILKHLPWNHYCRKMVGYLHAMKLGADIIADTDDDNIPLENWPSIPEGLSFRTLKGAKFINIYRYFTDKEVWPRGYPLTYILSDEKAESVHMESQVKLWQFLADEDPDVDAIYRLTNNTPIYFKDSGPIVLDRGTVCPINSQNTIFYKQLFPLLYLPAFVTFRFTDILRGLIAQPLLWDHGYRLGFGGVTVIQRRNPHDYLKDFESEVPVYLYSEKVVDATREALTNTAINDLGEQLKLCYKALFDNQIVDSRELTLLNAWVDDVRSLMEV